MNAIAILEFANAVHCCLRPNQPILAEPRFDRLIFRIVVHPEDLKASSLKPRVSRFLIRKFTAAWTTPCRPEIEQHILAATVRDVRSVVRIHSSRPIMSTNTIIYGWHHWQSSFFSCPNCGQRTYMWGRRPWRLGRMYKNAEICRADKALSEESLSFKGTVACAKQAVVHHSLPNDRMAIQPQSQMRIEREGGERTVTAPQKRNG